VSLWRNESGEPVMVGSVAAWSATVQQEKREKERDNEVEYKHCPKTRSPSLQKKSVPRGRKPLAKIQNSVTDLVQNSPRVGV
jgi:hypothetical protein